MSDPHTTWDGQAIATGAPQGSTIVVRRQTPTGWQYPILHRAANGPDHDGHWAWTPPAGMRQPGEPALTAAKRELAEETGITDIAIHPVDLARGHALWTATVGEQHDITLDHEHDRHEWLDAATAAKRCRPGVVAETVTTVEALPEADFAFRPMTRDDLPTIAEWSTKDHLRGFFSQPLTLATATASYGRHIDMPQFIHLIMITVDDKPVGMAQHRAVSITPSFYEAIGHNDGVLIGCALADTALKGRGLGPRLIWSLLRQSVLPTHAEAPTVWAAINPDNTESLRTFDKAGFTRDATVEINPGEPEVICGLRLSQWL